MRALAASLLVYAAFFQPVDALQVNCSGIRMRGCRDTRVPLVFMLVAYWGIGLPLGYGFGALGGMGAWRPGRRVLDRADRRPGGGRAAALAAECG